MSQFSNQLDIVVQVLLRNPNLIPQTAQNLLRLQQVQQQGVPVQQRAAQAVARTTAELEKENREARKTATSLVTLGRAAAALARQEGRYAQAKATLNAALRTENITTLQTIRIKQDLARTTVAEEQANRRAAAATLAKARADERAAAAARRLRDQRIRAITQAAELARAEGNVARSVDILRRALQRSSLTIEQRLRLNRALTASNQALARSQAAAALAAGGRGGAGGGGGFLGFFGSQGPIGRFTRDLGTGLRAIAGIFNFFTRILAAAVLIGFTIRTVIRAVDRFAFGPLRAISQEVANITDQFRRLEASLTGVTGSLRATKDLTRDVFLASRGLPISPLEALSGVRGLAFIPGTAQQLRPGEERVGNIERLLGILTKLATIDPDQGIEGARFAVREALAGEFRSLRFRFEISPTIVAASVGKSLEELKADPALTLRALEAFTNTFVGPEAIAQFNALLSTQATKLRGVIELFFRQIGESGFYDKLVGIVRNAQQRLSQFIGSTQGERLASRVSGTLSRFLDDMIEIANTIISRIAGGSFDLRRLDDADIDLITNAFTKIIDGMAEFAKQMSELLPDLLSLIQELLPLVRAAARGASEGVSLFGIPIIPGTEARQFGGAARAGFIEQFLGEGAATYRNQAALAFAEYGTLGQLPFVGGALRQGALNRLAEAQRLAAAERLAAGGQTVDARGSFGISRPQAAVQQASDIIEEASAAFLQASNQFSNLADRVDSEEGFAAAMRQLELALDTSNQLAANRAVGRSVEDRLGIPVSGLRNETLPGFNQTIIDSLDDAIFKRLQAIINQLRETEVPATIARIGGAGIGRITSGEGIPEAALRAGFGTPFRTLEGSTAALEILQRTTDARAEIFGPRAFETSLRQLALWREQFEATLGEGPLTEAQLSIAELFDDMSRRIENARNDWVNLTQTMEATANDAAEVIKQALGDGLVDIFDNSAENMKEIGRQLFESLRRIVIDMILEITVISRLRTLLTNALSPAVAPGQPAVGGVQGPAPLAFGGVLSQHMIRPMAFGGRLTGGPELIPLGGSRSALIGEAGTEAVLPLIQDGSGNLGVRSVGGRGATVINQHFNITTPNADSFRLARRHIQRDQRRAFMGAA